MITKKRGFYPKKGYSHLFQKGRAKYLLDGIFFKKAGQNTYLMASFSKR
jgi:hypothetical protein